MSSLRGRWRTQRGSSARNRAPGISSWALLRPYAYVGTLVGGTALALAVACLQVAVPFLTGALVDGVMRSEPRIDLTRRAVHLFLVGQLWVAATVGHALLFKWLTERALYDLRGRLLESFGHCDQVALDRAPHGAWLAHYTQDLPMIARVFSLIVGDGLASILQLLLVVTMIATVTPSASWIAVALIPLYALLAFTLSTKLRSTATVSADAHGRLHAALGAWLAGQREARLWGSESWNAERARDECLRFQRVHVRTAVVYSLSSLRQAVGLVVVVAIYGLGGLAVSSGYMTIGGLVALSWYAALIEAPVDRLVAASMHWAAFNAARSRVASLLSIQQQSTTPLQHSQPVDSDSSITAQFLTFCYDGTQRCAIDAAHFRIPAGARVAVIGRSGSGKSTLASLLCGLYSPSSGTLLLGGRDVREMTREQIRTEVAWLRQDAHVFFASLSDNISLGCESITSEHINTVIQLTGLTDFVAQLPDGINSLICDDGRGAPCPSYGQKRRLSMARVLARRPRIVILDEPSNGLDWASWREMQVVVATYFAGRTVLTITHSLREVSLSDYVLFLESGQVYHGTHQELMRFAAYRDFVEQRSATPSSTC